MGKYFGTDGFRGEAGVTLTSGQAYRIGRFLGWYYASALSGCKENHHKTRVVIGKDTRRSSYMFEYAIVAGLTASGADAYMLHVTTTPSVSFVTRRDDFDCGVMISASHNVYTDNGIKIVNRNGEKMDDRTIALLEKYLDGDFAALGLSGELPEATGADIGCITDYVAGRNRYVGYLISLAEHSYKNLRIGLDCANGASWMIAGAVFEALGARTYILNNHPNGLNINENAGSTHMEGLQKFVLENKLDLGFAFDGDADRCQAVDENGNLVTGDHILFVLANRLRERGALNGNKAVATIMSNIGLFRAFDKAGIGYETTTVGDRFAYECMQKNNYMVGGEQSGHIILKKYATTGDGILTAIMLTEEVLDRKLPLSKLCAPVVFFPQYQENVRVKNKDEAANDPVVLAKVAELNEKLSGNGRILLRRSGTEPVIRVMAEADSEELCRHFVGEVTKLIKDRGLSL